jgi:hypothetical protein
MAVQLDVISNLVEDMARSLASYCRLGLELPPELHSEPHAEVALPSGVRLAWGTEESVEKFVPAYQPPVPGSQRIGIAFLAESPAKVGAIYDELISLCYKRENAPWHVIWGQRYAFVQDRIHSETGRSFGALRPSRT